MNYDPTITSYLLPPDEQVNYKVTFDKELDSKYSWQNEMLTSLIFRGVLNVNQVLIMSETEMVKIPFNSDNITQKLSLQEIVADIVLYQILSWDNDRKIKYTEDARDISWETIKWHNCIIYSKWTYSIFDVYLFNTAIEKNDVISSIIDNIIELTEENWLCVSESLEDFLYPLRWEEDKSFFFRIRKQSDKLYSMYSWKEGKALFIRQIAKSESMWKNPHAHISDNEDVIYDKDIEEYDRFILNLENIISVISWENLSPRHLYDKCIEYVTEDYDFLSSQLIIHVKEVKHLINRLVSHWIPWKIKKYINKVLKEII